MWSGTQIPRFQAFPSPRQSGGSKGCLRQLHFMRPFAPCFGRLVAGAQVYLRANGEFFKLSSHAESNLAEEGKRKHASHLAHLPVKAVAFSRSKRGPWFDRSEERRV